MNVWIVNHYAVTPDMGGGTRHFDFAKVWKALGYDVTIFASSFHYATYRESRRYTSGDYKVEEIEGVRFVWIKTPRYRGNGMKRVINMLAFTTRVVKADRYVQSLPKPDIVVGSSVHLFAVYAAYRLARRYRIPFVMEVRDLWPQTLIDMGMSRLHPFVVAMGWLERFLYRRAVGIVTTMPFGNDYIRRYTDPSKIVWISNGTDTTRISGKPKECDERLTVVYTGSMGRANRLDTLLDAAAQLRTSDAIRFRLVGEGPEKKRLLERVRQEGLKNVSIEDSVTKSEIAYILAQADVLYVGLMDLPLYRYGISLNKIYDYMAAARPVVFAANAKNNPVKEADAGIVVRPDDAHAVAEALLRIAQMPCHRRQAMGQRARKHVEDNYDIVLLAKRYATLLERWRNG